LEFGKTLIKTIFVLTLYRHMILFDE